MFVDQIAGTLFTIANDVKIQVEFNPARVGRVPPDRLRDAMLNRTDFNNDKVDAGDIGSGATVTALYEITPVGSKAAMADPLRYAKPAKGDASGELAYLKIRYKLPGETASKLIERPIGNADTAKDFAAVSPDMRFAASVVRCGAAHAPRSLHPRFDYDRAKAIAQGARGDDALRLSRRVHPHARPRQERGIAAGAQHGTAGGVGRVRYRMFGETRMSNCPSSPAVR